MQLITFFTIGVMLLLPGCCWNRSIPRCKINTCSDMITEGSDDTVYNSDSA